MRGGCVIDRLLSFAQPPLINSIFGIKNCRTNCGRSCHRLGLYVSISGSSSI